ncbi:ribosome small subunit-dependent GTPase A [Peptostreptococcaceae bacterium OttesenSCG-928-C18]|nr:ribosome small subunit-dependent GTPase A [Peptostreptococcaceae bacterium OttesenSCG-928-C18]
MNNKEIEKWGIDKDVLEKANENTDLYIGRVISQHKDLYEVVCDNKSFKAEVSGKFSFDLEKTTEYPAVGDFILLDRDSDETGNAIIHSVLPRKSAFIRKSAGTSGDEQIVSSNIDTIFICMSLNNDFNLRRLERYLSISWDSGAVPVIVLTKADLCLDLAGRLEEVGTIAFGVDVVVTSSKERNYEEIEKYIIKGKTIAFIGSSGVGKSSLINCILGKEEFETKGLRNDDKGKHTTTSRNLRMLENGSMLIDTPGMRELGIESADLTKTFADIDELSRNCKFSDCTHTNEPGCAVKEAVESGKITEERLSSYLKLKKEAKYEGLNSKQIETEKLNRMFSGVGGMKNFRKQMKAKNKLKNR